MCARITKQTFISFLGIIYMENGKKAKAEELLEAFLTKPERERGYDKDAKAALKEMRLKQVLTENPVPFDPHPVKKISTKADEYLAIISPDEELCFFTRRQMKRDKYAGPSGTKRQVEEFTMAEKTGAAFTVGEALGSPFNENYNEGGATITANNKELFFTVCQIEGQGYQNCDIYYVKKEYGYWGDIKPLSELVNSPTSWGEPAQCESQWRYLVLYIQQRRWPRWFRYLVYKTFTKWRVGSSVEPRSFGEHEQE